VADAMVQEAAPDANTGKVNSMRSDQSPNEVAYLRFDIPSEYGPVANATLRLWVRDGSANAPAVAPSSDVTWSETAITWTTRPAPGTAGPDLDAVTTNTWIEYDVTSLVTGSGPVTLVLVPQSPDAMSVNTRENATNKPELVINGGTVAATSASSPVLRSALAVSTEPSLAVDATPTPATTEATPEPTGTEAPAQETAPTEAAATPQTGTVVNTGGEGVRCRVNPSADGAIITVVPEGSTITLRGTQEGEWLPVSCDGQDGYVSATYVAINGAETPTAVSTEGIATKPATDLGTGEATPTATATETATATTEAPTEQPGTPEATPYPVLSGWQTDPNVPWTLVTDNDPSTAWTASLATAPAQAELGFDLGSVVPVDHLSVLPTWPLTGTVELQLSNDGVTWFNLTTVRLEQLRPDAWFELPVGYDTRYTRFIVTNPTGAPQVGSLAEIQVWLEPSGAAQALNLLPRVTPTPVPTEAPTEVPVEPTVVTPVEEAPLAPAPTEAPPVVEPTPEPTLAPEPTPVPTEAPVVEPAAVPEEPPADDAQGEPDAGPEGSVDGT
jgi:uncharacterized protein YraI